MATSGNIGRRCERWYRYIVQHQHWVDAQGCACHCLRATTLGLDLCMVVKRRLPGPALLLGTSTGRCLRLCSPLNVGYNLRPRPVLGAETRLTRHTKSKTTSWHKVQTRGLLTPLSFQVEGLSSPMPHGKPRVFPALLPGPKACPCREGGREPPDCQEMYPGCFKPVHRWSPAGPRQTYETKKNNNQLPRCFCPLGTLQPRKTCASETLLTALRSTTDV